MSLRKFALPVLLLVHRLWRVLRPGRPGLRIVLLHDVPAAELPAFESLVAELAASGQLVRPMEAEAILAGTRHTGRRDAVLISFDDGFASNVAAAAVLERHGARGLFFVCPGLMDLAPAAQRAAIAANIFRGQCRAETLPTALMNWDEVAALAKAGHTIGNHSAAHHRLTTLSPPELEHEIATAAAAIAERLGAPAQWFAFTFGDITSIDATVLAAIGRHHRWCRSGVRGVNTAATPALALRADHVDLAASPLSRRLVVEGGLDLRYIRARKQLDILAAEQIKRSHDAQHHH